MPARALAGIRVLECGNLVSAAYATKLLADLGADVIKIETPGAGDTARAYGPFPHDTPHSERSGLFVYLNANKRSITLDLTAPQGRAVFDRLASSVDLVVHNVPPPAIDQHGLKYDRLASLSPHLVVTSITPFGLSGPHRNHAFTDLTLWNAGGVAYLNGGGPGSDELPPLKAYGPQAEYQGGLNGAIAALAALFARRQTGRGQHVVISIQECLVAILELTFEFFPYMGLVASRLGQKPLQPLDFFECRDGWIFICCVEEHQWQRFVEMMDNPEWASMELFETRLTRAANWDALKLMMQDWIREQSVAQLYEAAQRRRIPFAPVSTMGDLLASDHLKSRGFFAVIDQPDMPPLTVPGAPYRLSATPWELRRPAPQLGEHTAEVLAGVGVSAAELATLRQAGIA